MTRFNTLTFYGVGEFRGASAMVCFTHAWDAWATIRTAIAYDFTLDPADLAIWISSDHDAILLGGRLIGSLHRQLTDAEFAEISAMLERTPLTTAAE
jgi:hypothetical protein